MEITDKLIDKLAALSKLSFEADEKEKIRLDLQKMLDFVDQLKEIDVEGVEPLIHMMDEEVELRLDEAEPALEPDEVVKNAPEKEGYFFRVPKVVKK
ncbi:MAG: Asp-tRNA(Asn)/Glu-tRNA(Gln) amidotransferase subunit GatC [Bacteroidia bacterium]|nr:Asp-tRNA(Asn)/Glu-tRNA(Gln) amidotransferase subunit GatC [Bacteroidia bacterium]